MKYRPTIAACFSSFFEKAFVSRVRRRTQPIHCYRLALNGSSGRWMRDGFRVGSRRANISRHRHLGCAAGLRVQKLNTECANTPTVTGPPRSSCPVKRSKRESNEGCHEGCWHRRLRSNEGKSRSVMDRTSAFREDMNLQGLSYVCQSRDVAPENASRVVTVPSIRLDRMASRRRSVVPLRDGSTNRPGVDAKSSDSTLGIGRLPSRSSRPRRTLLHERGSAANRFASHCCERRRSGQTSSLRAA